MIRFRVLLVPLSANLRMPRIQVYFYPTPRFNLWGRLIQWLMRFIHNIIQYIPMSSRPNTEDNAENGRKDRHRSFSGFIDCLR